MLPIVFGDNVPAALNHCGRRIDGDDTAIAGGDALAHGQRRGARESSPDRSNDCHP